MKTCLLFPDGKEKALTLSYDDGVDTDVRFIELLEKFKIKCTFNLNSGCFMPEGSVRPEGQVHFRLSESESKKVYNNPFCEVATHGVTHPFFSNQPTAQCMIEIIEDRLALEKMFGKIIRGHAYSYGDYNNDAVDILKQAGIVYARTTKSHHTFSIPTDWMRLGATCHHNDPELMNLANKFINDEVGNNDGWLFYLWGHTYEFRGNDNWNVIEEFFQKVANCDNVWYATNIEVYDYVTAYKSLIYSADGHKVYNPTATEIWVKINGNKVCVPMGQTVNI